MNILQIVSTWKGGAVKVAFDIAKILSNRGHKVTMYITCLTSENRDLNISRAVEIENFRVFCSKVAKKIKFYITPRLVLLTKNVASFDIIHLHEFRTFQNIVTHRYAVKYGVPYVLQAHGTIPKIGSKGRKWLYDIFFGYKILRCASKVIALTKTEAEQYKEAGVVKNKIEIIPNGINPSEYRLPQKGSFKTKYGIEDDEKVVLYLGRIHKSKGIDLLINSFAILVKMFNNVKLVLVGPDDGFLNEALSLSRKLKLESKILFTGFVSKEEKLEALADADAFVTPSFYGFPITFLEACIAGVPIVTTTFGDILSWINGRVGFVSSATPEDLSKAVYKILSSNEIHGNFSRNCKDIVRKEFSIEKVVSKLEDLYRSVIH